MLDDWPEDQPPEPYEKNIKINIECGKLECLVYPHNGTEIIEGPPEDKE